MIKSDVDGGSVDRVTPIKTARLISGSGAWAYAEDRKSAIADHWRAARVANPNYFNGTIHVLTRLEVAQGLAEASLMPTDFMNFLYWRDGGYPCEAQVRDGFGSALIRSAEGYVLLGRQRPGNINEGLAYLPGGFIDMRDVCTDGTIDIRASVARELAEETGLGANDVFAEPGFILVEAAAHVSFVVSYNSEEPADDLKRKIETHIASEIDPELAEIVIVTSPADLRNLAMPRYARVLLASPLVWEGR